MASPHGDSFYCLSPLKLSRDGLLAYHSITLFSAVFGLVGALHNLRIWRKQTQKRERFPTGPSEFMTASMTRRRWEQQTVRGETSQRSTGSAGVEGFVDTEVVVGLAYADALACITLIVRSIMAFALKPPVANYRNWNSTTELAPTDVTSTASVVPITTSNSSVLPVPDTNLATGSFSPYRWWYEIIGGPVEFFLLYFYVATYFWTLSYALSVYCNLAHREMRPRWFKLCCWLLPIVPAGASIVARFYPSGIECATRDVNIYITYSCLYIPILAVMIINPIIYVKAFGRVAQVLNRTGQVTNQGRQMILAVKYKFFLILVFFYICWVANIVDGILQFSNAYSTPPLALWLVEAVLNPLQGLFNALIYGRHNIFKNCLLWMSRRQIRYDPQLLEGERDTATEFTESDRLVTPEMSASGKGKTYVTPSVAT